MCPTFVECTIVIYDAQFVEYCSLFAEVMVLDHLDMLDEARVTAVDDAIVNGRISMVIQNITSTSHPQEILYGECCACLFDTDGTFHQASEFIPNLEALGATPFLDRHVLNLALGELDANASANLGCNISVDNMSGTYSWASIYDQIVSRSYLAPRLILEIKETKPCINSTIASDFLKEVQKLGCRIAIDDFGVGYSSLLRRPETAADIVKIDGMFFHDLYRDSKDHSKLGRMVDLAGLLAPVVVINGIETTEQLKIAEVSGATHLQGYLLSKPSLPLSINANREVSIPESCYQNWNY